jgi:purine-binding chemotaxis protein CheW
VPTTTAPADAVGSGQLALLIPVGSDTYAISLESVREVVVDPRTTELPTSPPAVLGVFNVRGDIVPLLDTGLLLGLRPVVETPYAVLVETAHGIAGLVATEMPQTVRLSESVGHSDLDGTTETYLVGEGRLAVALDVANLLSPVRISR